MISPAHHLLASDRPLFIGHRGYCALAPENTLPSFQLAIETGADLIELDYQHSRDGIPVVIHDTILNRTTNARTFWRRRRIRVARKTAAEIQKLDAGSWFSRHYAGTKVPLLREALELICGQNRVALIERKSGDAKSLANLICELNLINHVVVISFDWKFLRKLRELVPDQILGALGPPERLSNGRRVARPHQRLSHRLDDLGKTGARIAVWNHEISARDIALAHERGLKVWAYTINDRRRARRLLDRELDGIITNGDFGFG